MAWLVSVVLVCLLLAGDIAVHFMSDEKREEMELEKLWALGEEYDDQCRAMAMNYEESLLMELK